MSIAVAKRPIVLVVEDDFLLRMDAVDIVRNAGFEAVQAANADEAIAIIEADPNIHVVFTDVQMPGTMDGLKLARFIRDRWPPIKCDIGPVEGERRGFAGRKHLRTEALQPGRNRPHAPRIDRPRMSSE
jgi:CheY-like chemotaxis protein